VSTANSAPAKVVDELFEGWTDFLGRLRQHIATGDAIRLAPRIQLGGELRHARAKPGLLRSRQMNAWMPFRANGLTARAPSK
jgi:hypothetical protein